MKMRYIVPGALLFAAGTPFLPAQAPQLSAQIVVEAHARRGYLGFSFEREATNRDGARSLSLAVTDVRKDSPAERAGLQAGDVILRLNGLNASESLLNSISGSLMPGDTVTLRVRRAGSERDLRLVAAAPPAGYFELRAVPGFRADSVRGMLRLFVDSISAGLDTTRFRFFSRDSAFVIQGDSVDGDSIVVRRFMYRFPPDAAFRDSVLRRFPMDSVLRGLQLDSALRRFPMDSAFRHFRMDSTFRGQVHVFPGDGGRLFEFAGPPDGPGRDNLVLFGLGARAIGGARLETLNPELGRYFQTERGVLVLDVPQNTPARRAGLLPGDVILSADGESVSDVGGVYRAFARTREGAVKLEVLRRGERRTLELAR